MGTIRVMLKINKLSGEPVEGIAYKSNLSSFKGSVYGGETFGVFDGFVNITNWFYEYDTYTGTLKVWKESLPETKYTVFERLYNITELSFTFDKQMLSVVSYMLDSKCYVYFFDSSENAYATLEIPFAKFPKVALNSIHFSHIKDSNVVLGYVKNKKFLYVRLQEDRYTVEYLVKEFKTTIKLYNIGYADTNRFQYEVLESMV